jgi:hypothetical protein
MKYIPLSLTLSRAIAGGVMLLLLLRYAPVPAYF